jgi:hypothetical protein
MAKRHGRMEVWLRHGVHALPPLDIGDTNSGIVVETLLLESYMVKVHGSRQATQRNR